MAVHGAEAVADLLGGWLEQAPEYALEAIRAAENELGVRLVDESAEPIAAPLRGTDGRGANVPDR